MTKATRAGKHASVEWWPPWPCLLHIAVVVTGVWLKLGSTHVIGRVDDVALQLLLQLRYNIWVLRSQVDFLARVQQLFSRTRIHHQR